MPEHRTSFEPHDGEHPRPHYVPVCSCGFRGAPVMSAVGALALANAHARAQGSTPLPPDGGPSDPAAGLNDHYDQQLRKLAEVGASLCCYMPGAGNPELWPESHCDCKYLPDLFSVQQRKHTLTGETVRKHTLTGEMTGCCEVRHAWRALDKLRGIRGDEIQNQEAKEDG